MQAAAWVRPPRKEPIQLRVLPLTPWVESLNRSFRWCTLSKAFLKSSNLVARLNRLGDGL